MTKNYFEIGRVVIANSGPLKGQFGLVINVVDQKRILLDSPTIKRQLYLIKHLRPTKYKVSCRYDENHEVISNIWKKLDLTRKVISTRYVQRSIKAEKKQKLTDFDRFKLYKVKKRVSHLVKTKQRALTDRWGKEPESKQDRKKNRLARLEKQKEKKTQAK